ncbi:hypothetical protein [Aminobacter sp. SR38]|jgi:hypothetical protein|uniref:hypothetical protein n=1 Tax=Aminobacter sp. SR38 TaxID=2774562 RepID=UPI00352E230C
MLDAALINSALTLSGSRQSSNNLSPQSVRPIRQRQIRRTIDPGSESQGRQKSEGDHMAETLRRLWSAWG